MLRNNKRAADVIADVLARALGPRAQITTAPHPETRGASAPHAVVTLVTDPDHPPVVLVPIPAGAGYPQDVRQALRDTAALHDTEVLRPPAAPVIVARRMSPGARSMLDDAGFSWADEDGNVRITAGPVVIALDAPASSTPVPGDPQDVHWSGAAGAVAELILGRAARDSTPGPLAAVTAIGTTLGISAPLVSRTLQRFDAAGWTERSGPGRGPHVVRRLVDPGAMLGSWATWRGTLRTRTTSAHALIPDLDTWLADLRTTWPHGRWAVTGEAAAQIRAPYLSRVSQIDLYLDPATYDRDRDDLLRRASLTPVTTGGRVRLLRADPHLHALIADHGDRAEVPLVPDVRLYADLLAGGVRGDEAAHELRDRRIGF